MSAPALAWGSLVVAAVSAAGLAAALAEAPQVEVITYDGVINPVAAEYVTEAIGAAAERRAEALILKLDTPGGLDSSMRTIVKALLASEVPVIVYVAPTGARAASAGVFITLAAHRAAMAPGTNIGAAHPVAMGGGTMDEEMTRKVENDAAAYIKSIAERRGRNVQWAENAVRKSVSATEQEALTLKLIDLVAPDLPWLLDRLDGMEVATAVGTRRLATKGAQVIERPMGRRLRILSVLSDPNVAYILMLVGIYGLIFELSNPGAIFPGVVGGIALILAFYAFQTLPINYAGLLLIGLAVLFFVAELTVPSYGLLTVGGVIALTLGSLMLVRGDLPGFGLSWGVVAPAVILTVLFFAVMLRYAWRSQRAKTTTGVEGLIGAVAVAKTAIAPRGSVALQGELWDASSAESIAAGESVEVAAVEGLTLIVKRRAPTAREESR
jgi:membrane-bound serine protease (ClpP class)